MRIGAALRRDAEQALDLADLARARRPRPLPSSRSASGGRQSPTVVGLVPAGRPEERQQPRGGVRPVPRSDSSRRHAVALRSCRACPGPPARLRARPSERRTDRAWAVQQPAVIESGSRSPRTRAAPARRSPRRTPRPRPERARSDHVDVALVELAEAAPRRTIGPPHRLNLVALEEPAAARRGTRPPPGPAARSGRSAAPGRPRRSTRARPGGES